MSGLAVGTSVPLMASPLQASPATSQAATLLPGPTGPTRSPETSRRAEERARRAARARERNEHGAQARANNDIAALRELAKAFGVSDEAEWAYNDLSHGLLLAGERGEAVPCQGPGRDAWTADDPVDQELAADLCLLCPVFALCQRYADAAKPIAGTWAGVTRNPAKNSNGRLRERKPGMCARGLHDVTGQGAFYEPPSGGKECLECRNARQERKRTRATKAPRPARPTSARSGLCHNGLHDVTLPGAIHVKGDGVRRCAECHREAIRRRNRKHKARSGGAPRRAEAGLGCTCGCGGSTKGGWYLSGHDSTHIAALAARVRDGGLTVDAALAEVAHSEKLQAKLAARLEG